eukprot:CAMPEP_0170603646 /NCGR_PEP_ID=MMETSP0224-20130122/19019_1 /TAXON_ID=285029 /ORGANISM="Togula jolla, Strain CCCM 725" /LENGTH=388 /DNA_ID=CAMNT_0010928533 /DNA_START=56 /DNA_END=1222 /DNA_ORIENTATION=-
MSVSWSRSAWPIRLILLGLSVHFFQAASGERPLRRPELRSKRRAEKQQSLAAELPWALKKRQGPTNMTDLVPVVMQAEGLNSSAAVSAASSPLEIPKVNRSLDSSETPETPGTPRAVLPPQAHPGSTTESQASKAAGPNCSKAKRFPFRHMAFLRKGVFQESPYPADLVNSTLNTLENIESNIQASLRSGQATDALTPPYFLSGKPLLIWCAVVLLFTYFLYPRYRTWLVAHLLSDNRPASAVLLDKRAFLHGLFEMDEPKLCLFTCICPAVRWADNLSIAGILSLLLGVVVFMSCSLIAHFLPGLGFFVYVCVLVYYRQRLRAKFQMPSKTWTTILEDFMVHWWCSPCGITQEARQMEMAAKVGHPAASQRPGVAEALAAQDEDDQS